MIATKTQLTGMLIAVTTLLVAQPSHAGGIITAGSSGTLYYGSWSSWGNYSGTGSTVIAGGSVPLYISAPIIPAYTPAPPQAAPSASAQTYTATYTPAPPQAAPSAPVQNHTPTYTPAPPQAAPSAPAQNYTPAYTPAAPQAAPSAPAQSYGLFGSMNQPSAVIVAGASPVVTASVSASVSAPTVTLPPVAAATPATQYDAFINFGKAPYADQAMLTTGTAQSWTTSPSLLQAYGHVPSAAELSSFSQTVLARVESTFASSGLSITATLDPNAQAGHMLSVVSGLNAQSSPSAVGVTNVGHSGFDFIDKLAYANSPDELEWAVAHNVAHELMHAFGGEHHTTPLGNNLDAPISDWSVLIDPNTKFSTDSVAEMTANLRNGGLALKYGTGAEQLNPDGQEISGQPVPEPATLLTWGVIAGVVLLARRKTNLSRRVA